MQFAIGNWVKIVEIGALPLVEFLDADISKQIIVKKKKLDR